MRSTQLLSCLAASTLATASIDNHNHPRVPGVGPHDLTAPTVEYTGSISTYSAPSSSQSPQSELQASSSYSSSSSEQPIDSTTSSPISVSPTIASTTLQSSQPSSTSPSSTAGQRPDTTTSSKPADATSTGGAIISGMQSGSGSVVGLLGFFIVGLIML